jgi:hypothetical protein
MPDEKDSAPKLDMVLSLVQDYSTYYREFHGACRIADDYYFGRNAIPTAEGMEKDVIRPATALAIVNIATDHVDVNNIDIDVPPASPRARARAGRLQKFYQGVWANIKAPVKRTAVKHSFNYGIGFLKVMWNSDRWPSPPILDEFDDDDEYREALADFMDERSIKFPFEVGNVNPKFALWDDSKLAMKWFIEVYTRDVSSIKRQYPEWAIPAEGQVTNWMEYWDDEWFGYIAGNQWVEGPHRHGYGFLPYVPILPGNSMDWNDGAPHERYRSILAPIYNLLDAEARLATQYEAVLRQYAWRTRKFTGPIQQATAAAEAWEEFGGMNVLPVGVDESESSKIAPPQELLQQLNLVQTMIEEATFPNVIRGVRPKGVSSGFGISVLAGMGRLVFQGVADGMARAIEQANSRFALLVQNKAKGRVTIHARSEVHNFDQAIGPDDVKGYTENIVILKAEAPEEREREAHLAFMLWNGGNGIISMYEAQKRAGVVNPLEEQNQMSAEQMLLALRPRMAMMAEERLGLIEQLAQAAGGDGLPPEGGNGLGNQFIPGMGQGNRVNEAGIQQQRMETNAANQQAGVFPEGQGGMDILGSLLGAAPGGAQGMPSGQTVG